MQVEVIGMLTNYENYSFVHKFKTSKFFIEFIDNRCEIIDFGRQIDSIQNLS